MATTLQVGTNVKEIVYLTIKDDYQRAVVVNHWLVARGKIDDRQPEVAKTDTSI